jgi:uncharacterized protein YdhG (YjbR/CyaY superfamily)
MRERNPQPATVDAYLAGVSPDARAALEKIRKAIRAAAPEGTEGLAWGMPSIRQRVWLVCYAAFKDHCSFFPMSVAVMRKHAAKLKGYRTTKGTIHFPFDKPLPAALVRSIVKARIEETRAETKADG